MRRIRVDRQRPPRDGSAIAGCKLLQPAVLVNSQRGDSATVLACHIKKSATRSNRERSRVLFRGRLAERCHEPRLLIDCETRDAVVSAICDVNKVAIWRDLAT